MADATLRAAPAPITAPAPTPVRVETDKLTAMYGKFTAVKSVSLRFPAHRVHALIGPSGCGKSTFLRTLNRMHELVEGGWITGRVLLDGADIYAPRVNAMQLRRRIGMVFQRPTPFPTMSIYDNVAAGLKVHRRLPRQELDAVVERSLRQAALWDEVKDRLRSSALALSGGQQQRLCIARTVAPSPDVILLDEPTASLDPQGTQRIEELLFELKRSFTIIIVTHNLQQAARVSDTTTFFYLGTMVETGPTRQIFTAPRNEQTEAYITG
ncbi:MAG TPA: phosphate ABC transporter ATP-binding protein PstB, partial [Gemmatimonadales bacterium]|nr:phosphate ABC transporter ATP-binding protein PstB [Gemmatimonadales bacterium]